MSSLNEFYDFFENEAEEEEAEDEQKEHTHATNQQHENYLLWHSFG